MHAVVGVAGLARYEQVGNVRNGRGDLPATGIDILRHCAGRSAEHDRERQQGQDPAQDEGSSGQHHRVSFSCLGGTDTVSS